MTADFFKNSEKIPGKVQETALQKLRGFCKHCTLHGFYYFSEKRQRLVYYTWSFIILASISLCAFLCHMIWDKFAVDPTFTVVESTHYSTSKLSFSSVTLCDAGKVYGPNTYNITNILEHRNFNPHQIEAFYNSFDAVEQIEYTPPDYVKKMHKVLNDLGYNLDTLVKLFSKPCEQLLVQCSWRSRVHNCSEMFRQVYTVPGYCCQFDIAFFKQNADPGTNFESGNDPTEALGILVNGQKASYRGDITDGYVFLYVNNDKNNITVVDSPTTLTPGGFFDVNIYVWVIDASKDVKSLSLHSRKCLLATDDVDTGRYYQECMSILILRQVIDYCRCMPFQYNAKQLKVEDYSPCTWEKLACIFQTTAKVKSTIRDIVSQNDCYQNCDYAQYETEIEFLQTKRGTRQEQNFSSVVVHFSSTTCLKYRREVLYAWDQMIANLGGIFGLCLGGSIISIIELIWFIFDFSISLYRSIRNKGTNNSQDKKQVLFSPKSKGNNTFKKSSEHVQKLNKFKSNQVLPSGQYPFVQ